MSQSTPLDVLRSQVDHPAGRRYDGPHPDGRPGRHRAPGRYRGPHGDDHRVGHADPARDAAPGLTVFDAVGLVAAVLATLGLVALAAVAAWQIFGIPGAVVGGALAAWAVHTTINRLEK